LPHKIRLMAVGKAAYDDYAADDYDNEGQGMDPELYECHSPPILELPLSSQKLYICILFHALLSCRVSFKN